MIGVMTAIGTKRTWLVRCTCPLMTQSGHRYCNPPEEGTFCLGQKSAGANGLRWRQAFSRRLAATPTGQRYRKSQRCLFLVIIRLQTTSFYGISHIVEYKDREGRHALNLFGTKSFV